MVKQKRLQWITTIMAVGAIFWISTPVPAALSAEAPTMGTVYPDFSEGILKSAKLEKMDKSLLLKAKGFEIRDRIHPTQTEFSDFIMACCRLTCDVVIDSILSHH